MAFLAQSIVRVFYLKHLLKLFEGTIVAVLEVAAYVVIKIFCSSCIVL